MQALESRVKDGQTDKCQSRRGTDRTVQEKKYPALAEAYQERIYFEDELRFGTRTTLKRRWTPKGHRPQCRVKIGYEYGNLYCALCPLTGDLFYLLLPSMEKVCFEKFVEEFLEHLKSREPSCAEATLMILDGAGAHQENVLAADSRLRIEKLPAASPEPQSGGAIL